ncbi:MAG: cation diffusion facilitator family transporter [Proteobacteria bacterium]|nr:cation diffusion facilitator family transporter [Pseudomonadota bacterium]
MASLARFAWLSVAAALATMVLKGIAAWVTGSVGLLSDALESFVNLGAALLTLWMLRLALVSPDAKHPFGYSKAEYFSAVLEGALILVAALAIIASAVPRLFEPRPIEAVGVGLLLSLGATAINLGVALVLLRASKQHHSIALEADAQHLLTDVWASCGIVAGVGTIALTGWLILDPLIAIAVAFYIVWTGVGVIRRSVWGLLDRSLPESELEHIRAILEPYRSKGMDYHALRTRRAGRRRLVELHLLVPGQMSVREGHAVADEIEDQIRAAQPGTAVLTHLEPIEDAASYRDEDLFR